MIVACGLKLNYGAIKGLEEAGKAYASGDNSKLVKVLQSKGVSSIYTADGSEATWKNMQKFIADAKGGKKVEGGMFGIKDYHTAIVNQFKARDFKWNYKHNLVEVKDGVAVFDKHWKEKGEYDEDLEEYEMITKHEKVEANFDFLHVAPPMKAPDEIAKSSVGSKKGWIPVNKETLQHVKYPNVFALGDVAAVPMGKTGGSARKQYKVVVNNVISMMEEGKIPDSNHKYAGYTVCPLITSIGTVMLAEFNWASKKTGSGRNAALLPLDPTQERWMWWLLKVYALKPMTQMGMLSGRA